MANINIELTKEQQQYLVVAVLFLGGGGFSYVKYFWGPTSARIQETAQKIEAVDGKIQKAQRQAGRLNKIKEELAQLNEDAEKAERQLPKDLDLPSVIDTISQLSKKHKVNLRSLGMPRSSTKEHFVEASFDVAAEGTYHDLGRFLAAIALEERIFNVNGLSFTPMSEAGVSGAILSVRFMLVSYQYKG